MDARSDRDLVAACRTGDREAYAVLVNKYYRRVFLVCMGILGNVQDAEDIAQDAMLKGLAEMKKLRDDSQFCPWVLRIARNTCISVARRKSHLKRIVEDKAVQQRNYTVVQNSDLSDLEAVLAKLPQGLRLPLLMYYFDGHSVAVVAERLKISAPTVYLKLRTATKQLHELFVRQGDAHE